MNSVGLGEGSPGTTGSNGMPELHRCPIHGCDKMIRPHLLMCGKHWAILSHDMRIRLMRAEQLGTDTAEYKAASFACIRRVDERLEIMRKHRQNRFRHVRNA